VLAVIFWVHVECVFESGVSVWMGGGFHSGSRRRPWGENYNTNTSSFFFVQLFLIVYLTVAASHLQAAAIANVLIDYKTSAFCQYRSCFSFISL